MSHQPPPPTLPQLWAGVAIIAALVAVIAIGLAQLVDQAGLLP